MKKDRVFVDANNIINWIPGNETGDIENTRLAIESMTNLLEERGPMAILVDLTKASRPNPEQRDVIIRALKSYMGKIEKVALFGDSPLMKVIAHFIINAAGYSNIRFFESRNQAETWLRQPV